MYIRDRQCATVCPYLLEDAVVTHSYLLYTLVAMYSAVLTQVRVLAGQDKDAVGTLLSVDEGDGIVRVKPNGEVKFFSLKKLAKISKSF